MSPWLQSIVVVKLPPQCYKFFWPCKKIPSINEISKKNKLPGAPESDCTACVTPHNTTGGGSSQCYIFGCHIAGQFRPKLPKLFWLPNQTPQPTQTPSLGQAWDPNSVIKMVFGVCNVGQVVQQLVKHGIHKKT